MDWHAVLHCVLSGLRNWADLPAFLVFEQAQTTVREKLTVTLSGSVCTCCGGESSF